MKLSEVKINDFFAYGAELYRKISSTKQLNFSTGASTSLKGTTKVDEVSLDTIAAIRLYNNSLVYKDCTIFQGLVLDHSTGKITSFVPSEQYPVQLHYTKKYLPIYSDYDVAFTCYNNPEYRKSYIEEYNERCQPLVIKSIASHCSTEELELLCSKPNLPKSVIQLIMDNPNYNDNCCVLLVSNYNIELEHIKNVVNNNLDICPKLLSIEYIHHKLIHVVPEKYWVDYLNAGNTLPEYVLTSLIDKKYRDVAKYCVENCKEIHWWYARLAVLCVFNDFYTQLYDDNSFTVQIKVIDLCVEKDIDLLLSMKNNPDKYSPVMRYINNKLLELGYTEPKKSWLERLKGFL